MRTLEGYSVWGDRVESKSGFAQTLPLLMFFHLLSLLLQLLTCSFSQLVCHIHSAKSCSSASWKKCVQDDYFSLQIVVIVIAKAIFFWSSISLCLVQPLLLGEKQEAFSLPLSTVPTSESDTLPTRMNFQNVIIHVRAKHMEAFEFCVL